MDWRSRFTDKSIRLSRAKWWDLYSEYIHSEEWRAKRELVLARDRGCRICGHEHELQVHHRTYARVGDEDLLDLTVLCVDCHKTITRSLRRRKLKGKVFDNVIAPMPVLGIMK